MTTFDIFQMLYRNHDINRKGKPLEGKLLKSIGGITNNLNLGLL